MARYGNEMGFREMRRASSRRGAAPGGYGMGPGRGAFGPGGRREGFPRERGQPYDTYYRRDFLTNQGDFRSEFGGGADYGYRGVERDRWSRRLQRDAPPRYGADLDRGYGAERSSRREGRTSYGPGFGERWETTRPEDIARRNFRGR